MIAMRFYIGITAVGGVHDFRYLQYNSEWHAYCVPPTHGVRSFRPPVHRFKCFGLPSLVDPADGELYRCPALSRMP
jgi:hypothetical protein